MATSVDKLILIFLHRLVYRFKIRSVLGSCRRSRTVLSHPCSEGKRLKGQCGYFSFSQGLTCFEGSYTGCLYTFQLVIVIF